MRFRAFTVLGFCVLLMGCDPIATEKVSVQFSGQSWEEEFKTAEGLIEQCLKTNGFERVQLRWQTNRTDGIRYDRAGRSACSVRRYPGVLVVEFSELGKFESRPEVVRARDILKRRLGETFGEENVRQDD